MIEKWQKSLDVGGHAGIVLIDLSKPLDSVHFLEQKIWILLVMLMIMSFTCSSELSEVLSKLKVEVDKTFKWFLNKYFKSNIEKCHWLTTSKSEVDKKIFETLIKSENRTTPLGVNIKGRLNIDPKAL